MRPVRWTNGTVCYYITAMIFLDESGKRWRRIKRSTALLSSTVVIPVGILVVASLLYLPSWGSISLPKPFHTGKVLGTSVTAVSPTVENKKNSLFRSTGSSQAVGTSQPASAAGTAQPSTTPGTLPPSTTPPTSITLPVTSPTQSTPTPFNQPIQTGNSEYGQSHRPTRS